ncbi:MAG TPA: branched-chain amino acid ABC transporter permease [Stellaceae bacterium]|nr:branched-chain amino acid ABC transporter permease [Stellaceae bacterium]
MRKFWGPIALWVALLLYPLVVSGADGAAFLQDVGATLVLAAISASAWNIVGGYAGQVSVGHAIFFGAGAYMPLLLYNLWETPPLVGVPLGILVAVLIALGIGIPSFRLQGHYFSMATIAVAELIRLVVGNWELLGAAIGIQGPASPRGWYDLIFRSSVPYYYIFLAVLAVVLAVTWAMERSRFGYYLRAIRAGERAAKSLGVPVRRMKLMALMLSAAFTAVAGSLYAFKLGFVNPESGLGILVSVQMIITAALGGAGTLYGPVIGAIILIPLQSATNTWFGGGGSGLTYIIYGGIILLLARFEPGGLIELWHRLTGPLIARLAQRRPRSQTRAA